MNNIITTRTVGYKFAEVEEDFILCEEPMSRLIFRAHVHQGGIRGRIIRQRRESDHDKWNDDKAIDIRSIGKNETINIELPTAAINKFSDAIFALTKVLNDQGVRYGTNNFLVVDPSKVIVTDDNKTQIIKKILDSGYSEDFWRDLSKDNPDLATRLSMSRMHLVRTAALTQFRNNLDKEKFEDYKTELNKKSSKDEIIWQDFFKENEWIFGYGLDYRFNMILQKEFHASDTEADGSDGVIGDYLLGDKKFTTFVELKLPTTPLFGKSKNRSGCWQLSDDLCAAVSQLLEQKASGEIKIQTSKFLYNEQGNLITNQCFNSKVILVIGNWDQITNDTPKAKELKEKTFELYRRELKNIEIITYDELYDRASFIANNK